MLDNLEDISKIDKSSMLDIVASFPDQIKETKKIINSTTLNSIFKVDSIVISGMGASGISGDILKAYFRNKLNIPIFVFRGYDLPKWVHKDTLVISQSYSGNTEETLSTFKHAFQKGCKIIGISSGGKLQELCEKREVPHIKIPSGLPPRGAMAYPLFSSLLTLKKVGIVRNDIDSEIEEVIEITSEFSKNNNKTVEEKNNFSKQIARKIHNTIPQVYGWGIYAPIARRWCQQFNENSKVIARYDEIPECNHNDIVGWSMNPEVSKKFTCFLFRDKSSESIRMSKRFEYMKDLFNDVAANVIEISAKGKKNLAKMMYIMYVGDFVSCYLAILRKVDPTPVSIIAGLKEELSKI